MTLASLEPNSQEIGYQYQRAHSIVKERLFRKQNLSSWRIYSSPWLLITARAKKLLSVHSRQNVLVTFAQPQAHGGIQLADEPLFV